MPFVSQAQDAWGHTKEGQEALGGAAKVAEWDAATHGKHLPKRVGHEDRHMYATGGPVLKQETDKHYKGAPQQRSEFGQFVGTTDRFTGGREVAGAPIKTDEKWVKPAGVGHTDEDDAGDASKVMKPCKPHSSAGHFSYAKSGS